MDNKDNEKETPCKTAEVTFLCLGKSPPIRIALQQDETLREFMIRCGERFPPPCTDGSSFFWSFIVGGKSINTFENRHRPVSDFVQEGDTVHCTWWNLGGPQQHERFKNNLHV